MAPLVLTFLSDYGLDDDFVGVCHGVIASTAPDVRVIDVSHGVPRHDIRTGALVLRRALPYFPPGVHLAVVDPEVGLHVRSLERLFVDQLGIAPKRLARLVRLRHVLGGLHSGGHRNLAELALACGYSDQPHLIRDFRALMGRRPGEAGAFRSRRVACAETRVVHRYRP